jgi:YidC/Oxa1 family membrane protein insertase
MDRNTVIGFSLIFLILMGYYWYTAPSPEQQAQIAKTQDSLAKVDALKQKTAIAKIQSTAKTDSTKLDSVVSDKSDFKSFVKGESKQITISNKHLEVSINTKGASVSKVVLSQFKRADSSQLVLLDPQSNLQNWSWNDQNGVQLNSANYIWQIEKQTPNSVSLIIKINDTAFIRQEYTLHDQSNVYVVDYKFTVRGMDGFLRRGNSDFKFNWSAELNKQERGKKWELQNSNVVYKFPKEDPQTLSATEPGTEVLKNKLQWVGFKQQYFTALIANKNEFATDAKLSWDQLKAEDKVKKMNAELFLEYSGEPNKVYAMSYYFGPNHYKSMQSCDIGVANHGIERIIPMGWGIFGWVNRYIVVPVFSALDGVIGSMGIIILLLTIIIKTLLLPLVYKSYISTAKMRILKPEIDEIKEKHGSDLQKVQSENMSLYKKAGVSPMSGCVPMLLQMPILFAMFQFFPNAFELRQKTFLWSHDLSTYDSILDFGFNIPFYGDHVSLFTLLMTLSTLIYTHLNNQISGVTGQMKWIGYFMPVIFLGVLNDYASGLTWYYFVSNMITFGQQYAIRRMVDDKKLHAQIAESRKKPVVKSTFQKRMEDAMKASQQKSKKK